MSVPFYFQGFEQQARKIFDQLKNNFTSIRSNRASPAILERVRVMAYGSEMPISQLATVTVSDARTIEIRPWDPQVVPEIDKAIQKSDLGITPSTDGQILRLAFPSLTEERRKEYVRAAKKYAEDARVAIRNSRRDAQEEAITKLLKEKKIPEDQKFRRQQELDQFTNKWIADIDHLVAAKEKDIFEI
ncbi:MAG: ribosome recycling factor [Elusimicrobia bacterium]|nr:ribosome recycling factor [Elusimicrobiota bacterium]